MTFVPPAAINDALGLLASLADPKRSADLLTELKTHVEAGKTAFDGAREAAKKAAEDLAKVSMARDEVEQMRAKAQADLAEASTKNTAEYERLAQERNKLAASAAAHNAKVLDIEVTAANAKDKLAAADKREATLAAWEADLKKREAHVASVMAELGPLAAKLGVK